MKLPKIEGFVIYNPVTDLYSKGGQYPKWSKKPKIWTNIGHVKLHLNQLIYPLYYERKLIFRNCYKNCGLFDIVTQEKPFEIIDYLDEKLQEILEKPYYKEFEVIYK